MGHYKSLFLGIAFLAFCWFAFETIDKSESVRVRNELRDITAKISELESLVSQAKDKQDLINKQTAANQNEIKEALFLIYPEDKDKIDNVFKTILEKNKTNAEKETKPDSTDTEKETKPDSKG